MSRPGFPSRRQARDHGMSMPRGFESPASSTRSEPREGEARSAPPRSEDRRRFVIAALTMFGVLAMLTVIVVVAAPWSEGSKSDRSQHHQAAISQPQSISPPDYGQKPQHPGDPGGWEQLALLGLLVVALGGGAGWIVHASHKNKRARSPAAKL